MNTAQFSKICMAMTRDLLTLHTQDFSPLIIDTITEVFKAQLLHFEDSLKNSDFKTEVNFRSYHLCDLGLKCCNLGFRYLYSGLGLKYCACRFR